MTRSLATTIALLAGLMPAMALAQTNLDKGKTPAQIFASDCAACHKAARGLAKGRDSSALTEFLSEHYTTSRQQAAGLAAYVLHGGGGESAGSGERGQKPSEHGGASAEEPKPGRSGRAAARTEAKPEPKEDAKPEDASPAIEEASPAEVKPADEKPVEEALPAGQPAGPGEEPAASATEPHTARSPHGSASRHKVDRRTATRGHRKEATAPAAPTPAPEQPASLAEPSSPAVQNSDVAPKEAATPTAAGTPTAAAPTETAPGESAPVPRDDIPD